MREFINAIRSASSTGAEWKGRLVYRYYRIPIQSPQLVRLTFVSTDSELTQGVALFPLDKKGYVDGAGSRTKSAHYFEDFGENPIVFRASSGEGFLGVQNCWLYINGYGYEASEKGDLGPGDDGGGGLPHGVAVTLQRQGPGRRLRRPRLHPRAPPPRLRRGHGRGAAAQAERREDRRPRKEQT